MSFDDDTALKKCFSGEYEGHVTSHWDSLGGKPNGGYLLALAVRALSHELPHPDPVAISAVFLRPGAHGLARVTTRLLRVGRRLSFGTAQLLQDGSDVLHVQAAYSDLAVSQQKDLVFMSGQPPELPPPEDCVDLMDGQPAAALLPGATIADRFEYRLPHPPGWRRGEPTGRPTEELWLRLRDGTPPNVHCLPLLVDAMAPVLLELGHGSTTVELTVYIRARPRPGWLSCRIVTRMVAAGLHEEDLELWDSSGTLVAQSRQLGLVLGSS